MAKDCTSAHCSAQQGNVNDICKEEGWPVGHKVLVCDTSGYCCNCTCSCADFGTLVQVSDNAYKAIEQILVTEKVYAAGTTLQWAETVVEFSNGTDANAVTPGVYEIGYGNSQSMIVTPSHLFLMPNGKLKRADALVPEIDVLVAPDGGLVPVVSVEIVTSTKGMHHIATGRAKPTSLNGHLLNLQGVVCADYVVELYQDELPEYMDYSQKLVAGSAEYRARFPHAMGAVPTVALGNLRKGTHITEHWPHTVLNATVAVPENASRFVTEEQAEEIRSFVPKNPYSDTNIIANVEYLFTIYQAFYPEVSFVLDWHSDGGNSYAFTLGSQKYVLVQGGLARVRSLDLQALGIILAHEISHFYGGEPKGLDGYTCEGQADFYGVRIVMRKVWYDTLYSEMVFPGIEQIERLFNLLSNVGSAAEGCVTPTLECRIVTFRAGATSQYLPACAGGPIVDYLEVTGATREDDETVLVKFNMNVLASTADNVGNYAFTPSVKVRSASVDPDNKSLVRLAVELDPTEAYHLEVTNLLSETGLPLDPEKSWADIPAEKEI